MVRLVHHVSERTNGDAARGRPAPVARRSLLCGSLCGMSSSSSRPLSGTLPAPGAEGVQSLRFPSRDERIPAVDERLVRPDTREEMIDGELYITSPADEPHATVHLGLATLLWPHLALGYMGALDM